MSDLRSLPSVDKLLQTETDQDFIGWYGRSLTVHAIRFYLEQLRQNYQPNQLLPDTQEIL